MIYFWKLISCLELGAGLTVPPSFVATLKMAFQKTQKEPPALLLDRQTDRHRNKCSDWYFISYLLFYNTIIYGHFRIYFRFSCEPRSVAKVNLAAVFLSLSPTARQIKLMVLLRQPIIFAQREI